MLRNNYRPRNLIGDYHFWVISPRNSTSFTRPFLAGRRMRAGHETTWNEASLPSSLRLFLKARVERGYARTVHSCVLFLVEGEESGKEEEGVQGVGLLNVHNKLQYGRMGNLSIHCYHTHTHTHTHTTHTHNTHTQHTHTRTHTPHTGLRTQSSIFLSGGMEKNLVSALANFPPSRIS